MSGKDATPEVCQTTSGPRLRLPTKKPAPFGAGLSTRQIFLYFIRIIFFTLVYVWPAGFSSSFIVSATRR